MTHGWWCRAWPTVARRRFATHAPSQGGSGGLTAHQKALMAKGLPKRSDIPNVQHVVLVASGKGGVGKSTTAVNLAVSLQQQLNGQAVGILDMDIFGPSLPIMMNLHDTSPELDKDNKMIPLINHGVHCMSLGFLVPRNSPMVWRGPMVMSCVQRLLLNTAWPPLHTLVVDLPPGTGDVALSISQLVNTTGAVIVSTPQDVALEDVRRGVQMMEKVSVPVLGVVQNMSLHVCSECGHTEHIFGRDGAATVAKECGVPVLGDVPIDLRIREGGDRGVPVVITHPQHSHCYAAIASSLLRIIRQIHPPAAEEK